MNSFFVLSFEDKNDWKGYKRYSLPKVKIKDYNVYDWWKKLFWSANKKMMKWHMITFEKLQMVKEMIIQLVVYYINSVLKNIIS